MSAIPDPSDPVEMQRRIATLERQNRLLKSRLASQGLPVDEADAPGPLPPIFVGGTGRSGTWLIGRFLGRDPSRVTVHTELRFHAADGRIRSFLDRRESALEFADWVDDQYFNLSGPRGRPKGLVLIASPTEMRAAKQRLVALGDADPALALRTFMSDVIDPYALGRGARGFIETTPDNSAFADCLTTVFPEGRVINIARDGRDAAVSVMKMPWGPRRPRSALKWWARRVRASHLGMVPCDPATALHVRLEELVVIDREAELERLLSFAGIERSRPVDLYFERRVGGTQANIGRWRTEISGLHRKWFDRAYRDIYEQLQSEGITTLPIHPDRADELHGA